MQFGALSSTLCNPKWLARPETTWCMLSRGPPFRSVHHRLAALKDAKNGCSPHCVEETLDIRRVNAPISIALVAVQVTGRAPEIHTKPIRSTCIPREKQNKSICSLDISRPFLPSLLVNADHIRLTANVSPLEHLQPGVSESRYVALRRSQNKMSSEILLSSLTLHISSACQA